jgi:hypothetical protein
MKGTLFVIAGSALLASACGGGSDATTPPPQTPPTGLEITTANAESVSKASYDAAFQSSSATDLVGGGGFIASNPGSVNSNSGAKFAARLSVASVQAVPIGPVTLDCQFGGNLTVSGDIDDPITPTLASGDVITVVYNSCRESEEETISGQTSMTIDSFSGDMAGGFYELAATMSLSNFQISSAADTIMSNGAVTVSLNTLQAPFVEASAAGTSLMTSSNTTSDTLTNFSTTETVNAGQQPAPYTFESEGTLDSSRLSGVVSYSTPLTFQGFDLDYPSTGELLITGTSSSARLIALDNVNVQIDVDSDGDNVVDMVINTTWAALED